MSPNKRLSKLYKIRNERIWPHAVELICAGNEVAASEYMRTVSLVDRLIGALRRRTGRSVGDRYGI